MSLSCLNAASLLQGRAAGLSPADGLLLEEHLGTCARCSAEALTFVAIVEVLGSGPPLRTAVRERAIARALAGTLATDAAPSSLPHRTRGVAAVAALAAVAAVLALLVGSPWKTVASDVAVAPRVDVAPHLLEGRGEMDGAPVSAGATWGAGTALRALAPLKVRVAHAVVDLDAETVVRWDASRATLAITGGRARLVVDPAPGEPFRVASGDILVEVLGTEFEVAPDRVSVSHGRVRVTDHGSGAVTELSAGETWVGRAAPPASPAPSDEAPSDEAPSDEAPSDEAPSDGAPTAEASAGPAPRASSVSAPHAAPVLARARRLLAAGKIAEAAGLVHAALGMRPTPSEEAEARTLLADCALASGDEAEAAQRYAEVAERHRDLPAGETALFAAARAEERAGRREAAVALFRRYLASHPQGRFRQEAQAGLQSLTTPRSPR